MSQGELKDLDHYLANPDELSALTDEQLDKLAEIAPDEGESPVKEGEEKKGDTEIVTAPSDEASRETDKGESEDANQKESGETAPEGVLSKDGKHVIPYWRLAQAESRARELTDKIAALEAQVKVGDTSGQPQQQSDDLESLYKSLEDFPEIQTAIRSAYDRIHQLSATLASVQGEVRNREAQEQRIVMGDVETAIAETPKIAYLQANDQAGWARACQIDDLLKSQPEWADTPFKDRFGKVAEVYETLHGPIPLKASHNEQTEQKNTSAKDISAKAKPAQPNIPTSMSSIPGGTPPAVDELAAVIDKSGPDLTARYMRMTPEQIEAELNRL